MTPTRTWNPKTKEIPLKRSYTIRVRKSKPKSKYSDTTVHGTTIKGEEVSITFPRGISVPIPAQFLIRLGIKEGDMLTCTMNEDNDIVFRKLYSMVGKE